jgi:hypothetical protein
VIVSNASYVDDIDVLVGKQLLVASIRLLDIVLVGKLLCLCRRSCCNRNCLKKKVMVASVKILPLAVSDCILTYIPRRLECERLPWHNLTQSFRRSRFPSAQACQLLKGSVLRHEQEDYWTIARASFASTVPLSKEFSCTAIEKV